MIPQAGVVVGEDQSLILVGDTEGLTSPERRPVIHGGLRNAGESGSALGLVATLERSTDAIRQHSPGIHGSHSYNMLIGLPAGGG